MPVPDMRLSTLHKVFALKFDEVWFREAYYSIRLPLTALYKLPETYKIHLGPYFELRP